MKLTTTAAVAALGVALSGCATIIEGTTQSLAVNTTPAEGAQCTLTNSQGTWYVTTPGSVVVHKTKTDLDVTCSKDGYEPGHILAIAHFGATTAANIAGGVGGIVVGGVVDAASGANYSYDNPLTVALGPLLAPGETASTFPLRLHCTSPDIDGAFVAEGPPGFLMAKIRFNINSGGDPNAISVTPATDGVCTVSTGTGTALASATFDIDSSASWTAGGKPAREIEKHIDIVETAPDANASSKTYTFRVKAKDATEGKITLNFPVRYH